MVQVPFVLFPEPVSVALAVAAVTVNAVRYRAIQITGDRHRERHTEYVPRRRVGCDGFVSVEVPPSPKFQLRVSVAGTSSVLLSVKSHERLVQLHVKIATGGLFVVPPPPNPPEGAKSR